MRNFLEDQNLLDGIAQGDSKCFESLLGKYKNTVFGFCMKMTGDRSMAEDLSQETWIKVVQNAHDFVPQLDVNGLPKAKVSTWILRIARNLSLNEIKKRKWEIGDQDEVLNNKEDPSSDLENLLIQSEDRSKISQAIESLPEVSRIVLTLWMSDEVSHSQIAEELNISVANVKVILFRAKKELQNYLGVKS